MFNIPEVEYEVFKKHFIKSVFVELRFNPISYDWHNNLEAFQGKMLSLGYSTSKKLTESGFQFKQEEKSKTPVIKQLSEKDIGYQTLNKDGSFILEIKRDRIVFVSHKYMGFSSLLNSIENFIPTFSEIFDVKHFNWAGLRKINEIGIENPNGYDGGGVNQLFFSPINSGALPSNIIVHGRNTYKVAEDNVTGFINVETDKQIASNRYRLIIDIDVNNSLKKTSDLKENLQSINKKIFGIFCWIASDDLIENLKKDN